MLSGSMSQPGVDDDDIEILRRQQRGREIALLNEPSKVSIQSVIATDSR